jgi:hypothetical protein
MLPINSLCHMQSAMAVWWEVPMEDTPPPPSHLLPCSPQTRSGWRRLQSGAPSSEAPPPRRCGCRGQQTQLLQGRLQGNCAVSDMHNHHHDDHACKPAGRYTASPTIGSQQAQLLQGHLRGSSVMWGVTGVSCGACPRYIYTVTRVYTSRHK